MKDFFLKNKRLIVGIGLFWVFLFVLFAANLTFAILQSGKYSKEIQANSDSTKTRADNWANSEIRALEKEQLWLEQELELAKSDSFSLGINLKDSVVQVQLKGTVLFQAKIVEQKPARYFSKINKQTYFNVFGSPARINSSVANIPKRALIKVVAPPIGTEKETIKADSPKTEAINWVFTSGNRLQIVINGVLPGPDSTLNIQKSKDVFAYRLKHAFDNPFAKKYSPVLYLWLNDTDAKAIYRALPEKAKFIFRN